MRFSAAALMLLLFVAGCGSSNSSGGKPTSSPPALNHVHSIVVMPNNPNTLYMGTHYHLYKSSNGGKNWQPLTKQMMLSMTMDLAHPSTLYAVSLQNGLLKSSDGGAHWSSLKGQVPMGKATGVTVSPTGSDVLAYGSGVYRSTDGGKTWTHALGKQSIDSAAFGATTAYAASNSNGLYVSHDGGATWQNAAAVGNQPVLQVVAAQSTAYAVTPVTIMRSTNNGQTWRKLSRTPFGVEFVGVAPRRPNEVIAEVGGKGFYASYNGGATWTRANKGIHDTDFNASLVRITPSSPRIMYTGAWGLHFYASHDGGHTWKEMATLAR
jgi:photosystem II stability/assembly factor-like uncharacterized protein